MGVGGGGGELTRIAKSLLMWPIRRGLLIVT